MSKSIVTPQDLRDFAVRLQNNIDKFSSIKSRMDEKLNSYDWQDAVAIKFKSEYELTKEPIDELNAAMEEFIKYLENKATILEGEYLGGNVSDANYSTMAFAATSGAVGLGGMAMFSENDSYPTMYDQLVKKHNKVPQGQGLATYVKATGNGISDEQKNKSKSNNKFNAVLDADNNNANIGLENELTDEFKSTTTANINPNQQKFTEKVVYENDDVKITGSQDVTINDKKGTTGTTGVEIEKDGVKIGAKSDGTKYASANYNKASTKVKAEVDNKNDILSGSIEGSTNISDKTTIKSRVSKSEGNGLKANGEMSYQMTDSSKMSISGEKSEGKPAKGEIKVQTKPTENTEINVGISKQEGESPESRIEVKKTTNNGEYGAFIENNGRETKAGMNVSWRF